MIDAFFQRPLGRTGVTTTAMALGCYSMSNAYGARSDDESKEMIRRAVDAGIAVIDTADYYGWGHNEQLVASALQGRRHEVLISSKFGYVRAEKGLGTCGDPAYVHRACEESARWPSWSPKARSAISAFARSRRRRCAALMQLLDK